MKTGFLLVLLALPAFAQGATLDEKLAHQWNRYEKARAEAVEKVAQLGGSITREQWEALLLADPGLALGSADLVELQGRQAKVESEARARNREASVLDLDAVRQQGRAAEFCARLPKGGMLHVHPWGTLDQATLDQILEYTNAVLKPSKLRELLGDTTGPQWVYPGELDFLSAYADLTPYKDLAKSDQQRLKDLFFLTQGPYDFKRFAGTFALISQVLFSVKEKDPAPLMWDAFFKRARDNQIRYAEISGNVPKAFGIPKLDEWRKTYEDRYGVIGTQLGAFNRTLDPEKNRQNMKDALALPASDVFRGVNLVADEGDHPILEKGQTIYSQLLAARASGATTLGSSSHSGEIGDVRNLRDSFILGVERIGHGTRLKDDPVALQWAIENRVAVEANLTSNVLLMSHPDVETHPFLKFLRLGLRVSLSTDDEGIFGIDLNHECKAAIERTDLSYAELRQLAVNSIGTSFAPAALKEKLLADLEADLALFEQQWK